MVDVFPVFEHTHDARTTTAIVVWATILGLVAGWLVADFGLRTHGFILAAVLSAFLLYRQRTDRAVAAAGLYSLAALVALVPICYELALVAAVSAPLVHLLSVTDLVFVLVFWVLAAVPALAGYRLTAGPLLDR